MSFGIVTFGSLAASGAYMAWSDLVRRRLPNVVAAGLAIAGLAAGLALVGSDHTFSSLIHMLVALGIGFCVSALDLVGSGDAKYYAGVAAWFPLSEAFRLLGWVALAGFLIALIWLIWMRSAPSPEEDEADFAKVPFGIAIAAGAVLASAGLFH